ncbi:alcohol dehydrogenase catalytic domain-containing protein [Streptomyces sp. bgisy159]|uniref:alcohol dehydrogenase catalytic domain-containing protein n=1 Tax=Streptomyces sp. bgisy159 TaxID=3413795 RepID=UPI003F4A3903
MAGFDTHAAGHHPFIGLPYHPGHEAVGVVVATVGGPRTSPPGDGVIVEPGPAR